MKLKRLSPLYHIQLKCVQAGGIASASVWSSCGCRQRLLAAVTSSGRAVHWAAVPAPKPRNDSDLCRFNYTFPVTADMAPMSSLLVYYVTEDGEPVSDVVSFHVKLLHKELSTDGVTIAAPSEAGRWSLWALSLSNHGLRFSSPKTINVFRPIQLDFALPPALKVGETVEVDVKITNNINNCLDVTALLALSAGASFASTGALYVTERLRLGPRGGTQLVVRVAVNTPGRKNITVEITGYSADNCSISYTSFNNESLVGSVIRSASVLVLPEGLHRSDTQSAYFCANGYDVHLASAEQTETEEECSGSTWCAWWVWWEGGRLSVGKGAAPNERPLLMWPLPNNMRIQYVGFSALWGNTADFRIWNFNEEAGFSQVLELGLPHGVVPGSASGTLLVSGGLHLPIYSISDAPDSVWKDSQLSAAAANLSPLLALQHIPHLIDESEKERILKKLPEQVQILLSFRKSDNSFSDHPAVNSHLSTIKILEILSKIQSYYPIDPDLLQSVKTWIQKRQNPDGSFTPLEADKEVDYYPVSLKKLNESDVDVDVHEYYYFDKDGNMTDDKIEAERTVEVTAETLVALLEVGVENQLDEDVAKKAQRYLEENVHELTSPAALAATVLALVLARSPVVPEALEILRNYSTTEEGEFGWPAPRKDAADWLLEETSRNIKTTSYEAVSMEQYVAGVRVLLAACARGALAEGEAAARFLYYRASTLQKHPSLAYSATKAAAQHRALTVSLATAGMELTDTLELRATSPNRELQLPGLPTKVFVYATGAGCATVQGTITYSTYTPKPENALLNIQAAIIEEIRPERSSIEELQGNLPTVIIKTCFKWKGKKRSGILRVEVSLFSGYELHSVNPVVLDGATFADLHYGSRGESIWFVFNNISSTCPICVTYEARSKFIITSLRPGFAKIYPLSRPDLSVETFFHATSGSPLLKGITDDDMITWFNKPEIANFKSSSIDNICECGRICSRDYEFRKPSNDQTSSSQNPIIFGDTEFTDIVTNIDAITVLTFNDSDIKITTRKTIDEKVPTATPPLNLATIGYTIIKNLDTFSTQLPASTTTFKDMVIPTKLTKSDKIDNNLLPMLSKESPKSKTYIKKVDIKKKPLPRRKGTLKATYGDKQEVFFPKTAPINITSITQIKNNNVSRPTENIDVAKIQNQQSTNLPIINVNISEINGTISSLNFNQETTTIGHTITAITKSNIKSFHYRTKKPKAKTQIPKPKMDSNQTNTKHFENNKTVQDNKNKTSSIEIKPKQLKSINKEIHKIPPTPMSETSRLINDSTKTEITPDKDGFEILDKNHLWDLLKEDPDNVTKLDDKIQVHNILNVSVDKRNDNKSL
ncbi:unnamed protein product [Leptidea sinapis]|uniref:Alpha-2-macroglobulin domain-containing protein n=1 Tax=Leptidea sinapis TaxID=189913 RepID=A0A5E4Q2G9_9NEOP|nr:unnamed protein product [Leptidea sinapis]